MTSSEQVREEIARVIGAQHAHIPWNGVCEGDRKAADALLARWPVLAGVTDETSDGYHTFAELYEYRMLYNAHAAHGWLAAGIPVVKSWRHSDGEECFGGGWFIVTAELPAGQVSNHYAAEHWGLFEVPEVEAAPEWDGHTPADAATRLRIEAENARPGLVTDEMVEAGARAVDPAAWEESQWQVGGRENVLPESEGARAARDEARGLARAVLVAARDARTT